MAKSSYGLPNALPMGMVEPIEQMDLVMAKINHDGHKLYSGIEQQLKSIDNKES